MPHADSRADAVVRWLLGPGRDIRGIEPFVEAFCETLVREALPVDRLMISSRTLHPQAYAYGMRWLRGGKMMIRRVTHAEITGFFASGSPIQTLVEGGVPMRRHLVPGESAGFRDLDELRDAGFTDWYAIPLRYEGEVVGPVSFATKHPAGFTDADIAALDAVFPVFELHVQARFERDVTKSLLATYLGVDAGERVLAGQVRRGDGQRIRAVLWMSDLRDFTGISDRLPMEELLAMLNDAFECQATAVQAHGGQVLKFIGDGMLASFPVREAGEEAACAQALAAARETWAALATLNAQREAAGGEPVRLGIALHLGEVMYGNIGGRDRLDFTVIGPAVNRSARIEPLTKPLGRPVLASAEFAAHCGEPLEPMGTHALKGVVGAHEVFAVPLG